MDIDIILEADLSARQVAELGTLAESYGIRAVWTSNYADSRDAFLAASLLSASSSSILSGPCAVSPMELHPLKMTNALFTLNEISNGRTCIVVGGGGGVCGSIRAARDHMSQRVGECLEILKLTAEGKRFNYNGEFYQVGNVVPSWANDAPPPAIYVGANGSTMFRVSTALADGIMAGDMTPKFVREIMPQIDEGLKAAGRTRDDFRISNFWAWHVKEDKADALWEARQQLALRGVMTSYFFSNFLSEEECDVMEAHKGDFFKAFRTNTDQIDNVPEDLINKMIDNITSTGTVSDLDRHIARLKEFEDAGLTELAIRVHQDPVFAIKTIGEKVMPAL